MLSAAVLALWPLTGAAASPPDGAAIAMHGAAGLPPCASCHGAKGEGNAAIGAPRLAGVGGTYLAEQLAAFASGTRSNPIMSPIAKMLTPPQETAIVAYFSSLPPPVRAAGPAGAGPANSSNGAKLANRGRWSEGLPACAQCHGPAGSGVGAAFPPLAGLPAAYIVAQIEAWQQGKRPPGPLGLMTAVARKLSPSETKSVADYFAALATTLAQGAGK